MTIKTATAKRAKPQTQELTLIPTAETVLAVFTTPCGLDPHLALIRAEIDAFVPDVTTAKGRDAIASIAHSVARSKTTLDDVGKELVTKYKEIPKQIDAERKRMRDLLDVWKDEVRAPLNEWEEAEAERVRFHKDGLYCMQALADNLEGLDVVTLKDRLAKVMRLKTGKEWEEFELDACRTKQAAQDRLATAIHERQVYEDEQKELETLRAQKAEREEAERKRVLAEKIRKEEQARADREVQAKLDEAERLTREANKAREDAERNAQQAKEWAAGAEKRAAAAAAAAPKVEPRTATTSDRHRRALHTRIAQAFVRAGMQMGQAQMAVEAIAEGKITNVTITY